MTVGPELWLIAGPNGAGKTTFAQRKPLGELIDGVRLLNPDDLTLQLLQSRGCSSFDDAEPELLRSTFIEAANRISDELTSRLQQNEKVAVETVLSSDKYKPAVEFVRQQHGFFGLIYVALRSPELACQRVARRHSEGGHDVPADKVTQRWSRSLNQLPWFACRADRLLVFDNSNEEASVPPQLLASGIQGRITVYDSTAIPEICDALNPGS